MIAQAPNRKSSFDLNKLLRLLLPLICLGALVSLIFSYFTTDRGKFQFSNFSMYWLLLAMLLPTSPQALTSKSNIWQKPFNIEVWTKKAGLDKSKVIQPNGYFCNIQP